MGYKLWAGSVGAGVGGGRLVTYFPDAPLQTLPTLGLVTTQTFQYPLTEEYTLNLSKDPIMI